MEHPPDNGQPSSSTVTTHFPSSSSEVHEEERNGDQHADGTLIHRRQHLQERQQQRQQSSSGSRASYLLNISIHNVARFNMDDDVWSCVFVLIIFWLLASTTLILGYYGSVSLQMGPNSSRLLQSNSYFVQSIQFEELDDKQKPGLMVYGFHGPPPLDVEISWTETHDIFVPTNLHKEWLFFLNQGSQVNISYTIRSAGSLLSLVIAKGFESLVEWVDNPSYPNSTLSWNVIDGTGKIQQEITKSSDYYIAVGNLNREEVQVQLNFSVKALTYDTSQADYRCSFGDHLCVLELHLLQDNVAVLSSSGRNEETLNSICYVRVSYGPRWITYLTGSGVMTVLVLLASRLWKLNQSSDQPRPRAGEMGSERAPLLPEKDDDFTSCGSSYDSISNEDDEERLETTQQAAICLQGKPLNEGERSNKNPQRLCVVCFDSPRDCFFLPCGHCATCFTCGTRIAEDAGTCPMCRRTMKKVRKVFTV